jgi:hypothetical protein
MKCQCCGGEFGFEVKADRELADGVYCLRCIAIMRNEIRAQILKDRREKSWIEKGQPNG